MDGAVAGGVSEGGEGVETAQGMLYAYSHMQINSISCLLKVKHLGNRSYVAVFQADAGTFELFLAGASYPGELTGFMSPSLRNQTTGQSWVLDWPLAEIVAAHLEPVLDTAGTDRQLAQELISALLAGKRYGHEGRPEG